MKKKSTGYGAIEKCWQLYNCDKVECPGYKNEGIHCWLISGTHCHDEIKKSFRDKIKECVKCDVFICDMDKGEGRGP